MVQEITIRDSRLSDIEPLTKVINAAYRESGGWTTERALVNGDRISEGVLRGYITDEKLRANQPIFVAEMNGEIVGCIQATLGGPGGEDAHKDEGQSKPNGIEDSASVAAGPASQSQHDPRDPPKEAMIGLFAVKPSIQSKGTGKILIHKAFDHMTAVWKVQKCVIWVLDSREELLKWYGKLGFVWDGVTTQEFVWPLKLKVPTKFQVLEKTF